MPAHPIASKYNEMKNLFGINPLSAEITEKFKEINDLCQIEINGLTQIPLTSRSTATGKNYVVFSNTANKYSRPVNIDLYNAGCATNISGIKIIDEFWSNVQSHTISTQDAHTITAVLYAICMNYCCCADLIHGVKNNSGDYFEKLVGHLYSMHLNVAPTNQMNAVELDGESISLPTDFIFEVGAGRPKFHVPAKASTRERVVEVWAQQRVLDGAFGVGRFLCLLTCIGGGLCRYLCHGDLDQHHVLMGSHYVAIVEYNRMHLGLQVEDLYRFMRKVMEKHNWNLRLGGMMLAAYERVLPMTKEERRALYYLFLYPEKYWKQINYYYNANKAWLPARNIDKLKSLKEQEEARQAFLREIK